MTLTQRAISGSVAALLSFAFALPAQAPAMFRGDTLHTGVYPASDLPNFAGVRWSVRLDGPIRGSPVTWGDLLCVGTTTGTLTCLDRHTGTEKWHYDAGAIIGSTPAVAGGVVYLTTGDGRVHAVDAGTGAVKWKTAATREAPFAWGHESGDVYLSSPVIAGAALYAGNGDGALYRVALASGKIEWKYQTGAPIRATPAYAGGTVYVGSADGSVYAVDAGNGQLRWRYDTDGHTLLSKNYGFDRRTIQSSPALDATTLYIGARDGFLYALDRKAGTLKWRFDHKVSWVNSSPALAHGMVYDGTSDGHWEQAVNAETGVEQWRTPTAQIVWGSTSVVGQTLYYGEGNGNLYAVDALTGKERWRWRGGARIYSTPVAADSTIYLGADDGSLTALAVTAGPPLTRVVFWDSTLAEKATFAPHPAVKTAIAQRGFKVVGAAGLADALNEAGAAHTAVVFAMDVLPAGADSLLIRFLRAGGRVVWLGLPPYLWPEGSDGERSLKTIDRDAIARVLGVGHSRANFDPLGVSPTAAGKRLGLEGWLTSSWSADTAGVTVLARDGDGDGRAGAWRKGGFVRLLGGSWRDGIEPQLFRAIQLAAELRTLP